MVKRGAYAVPALLVTVVMIASPTLGLSILAVLLFVSIARRQRGAARSRVERLRSAFLAQRLRRALGPSASRTDDEA